VGVENDISEAFVASDFFALSVASNNFLQGFIKRTKNLAFINFLLTGLSNNNNSPSSSSQFLVSGTSGGSGANSGAALAALSAKRLRGGNGLAINVVAHQVNI
jgi:hypothetical protein